MPIERNNSPTIKAVIFDYGLVLVRSPTKQEFGRMAQIFNVGFELFYQLWESSRDLYDRGDISAEEYWQKLASKTNTSIDPGQIEFLRKVEVEIWSHPYPEMLDWVRLLQTSGIKTGVLSNMPLDLAGHVRTNGHWVETFDFKTLSAEVRMIKPERAIYEHTLNGLGVAATETLFLDDREPNIRAARTLGIHAIQFSSIGQLRKELEVLGFPIPPVVASSDRNPGDRAGQEAKFQL